MGERVVATKHEQILKYIENLAVGEKISVRKIAKNLSVSRELLIGLLKMQKSLGLFLLLNEWEHFELNGSKKIVSKN